MPAELAKLTLTVPYNDIAATEEVFARQGDRIAAVIVEPIVGNGGFIPPIDGFLQRLRAITEEHGALLIFDEVMTGFRVAPGGAQAWPTGTWARPASAITLSGTCPSGLQPRAA